MNYILTEAQLDYIEGKHKECGELYLQSIKKVNGNWCLFFNSTRGDRIIEYARRMKE